MRETLETLAATIRNNLESPYPYKTAYVLESNADARPPAELTPAFASCFDWHSSVHNHWALVRLLRVGVGVEPNRAALSASLTADRLEAERAHLARPSRAGFEVPYGLSWLLLLAAEVAAAARERVDDASDWHQSLRGLTAVAADRLADWLARLPGPVRGGQHSQTAFAMTSILRASRADSAEPNRRALADAVRARAAEFYRADRDAPTRFEPSAYDFVSPSLAEAELMSLVLSPDEFASWHHAWLPNTVWQPAPLADNTDGKLAHLGGLNLSRAWMMRAIANALPDEQRATRYRAEANAHADAGFASLDGATYAGLHWIPTFAIVWATGGLAPENRSPIE